MRRLKSVCIVALVLAFTRAALGADLTANSAPADDTWAWWNQLYNPQTYELRGGVFGNMMGPEIATFDVNAELVLPKFFTLPGIANAFIPRFDFGGNGNVNGKTSFGYFDLLWTANYTTQIFGELSAGIAVHDGPLSELGCRELVKLGANLGYRIDGHWSAMLSFQHLSNGERWLSQCPANDGLNLIGLRVGYGF